MFHEIWARQLADSHRQQFLLVMYLDRCFPKKSILLLLVPIHPCLTSTAQLLLWRELVPASTPPLLVDPTRHSSAVAIARKQALHAFPTTTDGPSINGTEALALPHMMESERGCTRCAGQQICVYAAPRYDTGISLFPPGDETSLSPGFQTELWFTFLPNAQPQRMRSKSNRPRLHVLYRVVDVKGVPAPLNFIGWRAPSLRTAHF